MGVLSFSWVLFSPSIKKRISVKKLLIGVTAICDRCWEFV